MKPTDVSSSVTPPVPAGSSSGDQQKRSKIDTSEAAKLSFWISQFFILIATVLGVYLAANQGFKQALAYGDIQSARNNYYLRKSLQNEMSDNLVLVRGYMQKIEKGNLADRKAQFRLDTFVWESLKFSNATLETPSDLLAESRQFYRQVADIQERVANNDYSAGHAVKLLTALVERMEKEVLPKFEANVNEIKAGLKKQGIDV
ncbi:hypothetical protein [Geminisphaera colitermitum]|uniref:hypothetical protein n=1 Tax=Geminisphaera colitermitum TaxID=1148786 RepID=UPI000158C66E|nr:hypothetical protein [Geminisphaera colitermitum]